MKKIIVTAGLTVALLASSSIATHQYIKVEQLQEQNTAQLKIHNEREKELRSTVLNNETALRNYAELNEQYEMKIKATFDDLSKEKSKNIELKIKSDKILSDLSTVTYKLEEQKRVNNQLRQRPRRVIEVEVPTEPTRSAESTKSTNVNSVSRGTNVIKRTVIVTATAYTAYCAGCSGVTRTGIDLRKNPNLKVIAVDPNVIPLGSKVYVEGYGHAIAGDTGGDIKGNRIDLFIPSEKAAFSYGRKHNITVQILSK